MNSDQVKIFADRVFWDNLVDEYVKNGSIGVQGVQTRLKRNVRFESK